MSGNEYCTALDENFTKILQLIQTTVPFYDKNPEIFERLLDEGFDVDYRIPDSNNDFETNWLAGSTIFQVIYNTSMSKVLIERGADYTVKDKEGSTVLLVQTSHDYEYYLKSLKTSFAGECYANVILSAHINSGNPANPKDKHCRSHFHVACMYNRADAAQFFLDNGVPINETVNYDSEFYPGFSALHFAVKSCAFETADLLLTMGADMFAKDSKGMNPLHVLIADRKDTFVTLKRLSRIAPLDKEKSDKLQNYYNNNEKLVYLLLEKMYTSCTLTDYIGLSYFHVLCFMGNTSRVQQFLKSNRENLMKSVSKDSPMWPGYTALHFAAHSNVETVELLMKMGADINAKDVKGMTPFDICLREFPVAGVHRIFSLQTDYSNIVFSDGKTKLGDYIHAITLDTASFNIFLKNNLTDPNMFIPFDSPVCAGYTPLHLTIICTEQPISWSSKNSASPYDLFRDLASEESKNYISRVISYLAYNPEVTTRDVRGSTPLHWAFRLQQSKAVHFLLDQHESSSNYVDEHGLSHLHIACAAGDEAVVEKLLRGGANVNGIVNSSYTWINVLVGHTTDNMMDKNQAPKHFINESSTPLHFATSARCAKIVEILVAHDADVLAKDAKGLNPLERMLKKQIFEDDVCPKSNPFRTFRETEIEIVKLLVRRIGDKLADTKPSQMLRCYNFLKDKLLSEILTYNDESSMKILESVGITALHVACFTRNLERVNESLTSNEVDVNARVNLKSPLWPGCTPLHLFTRERSEVWIDSTVANRIIVDALLIGGSDVNARNVNGDTPIHQLFSHSRYHLGKLLKWLKDFKANPMGKKGFNHLHIASACGVTSTVEKLLEHGAIVDQPADYFADEVGGFTALHLAAAYRQNDVIEVLLKHGADVNWRNSYGGNSLHAANGEDREPCLDVLRTLINAGADIHPKNMYGETPLEALIRAYNRIEEEVELLVMSGSRVNYVNSMSDEGLLATTLYKSQVLPLFHIVIKAFDVRLIGDDGRNAIHNVVTFKRPDWSAFDTWTIDERYPSSDDYIEGIGSLLKLRLNINQQDRKGTTPLHVAAKMQNLTGIVGLLENGADINFTDADGKPAFAYSLELTQLHEELMELDERILQVIATHICKFEIARIGISQSNREVYSKIAEEIQLDMSKVNEYHNDLERMREEEIYSTSVTLREFLSDTWAISAFPYFLLCKRKAIDHYFSNEIAKLRQNFSEFTGILLLQYRKAMARIDMIDPAIISLNHLAGFDVPAICSRMILNLLSNDELSNMVSSTMIQ